MCKSPVIALGVCAVRSEAGARRAQPPDAVGGGKSVAIIAY